MPAVINHYLSLDFALFIIGINYNPLEALESYYIALLRTLIRIIYYYFRLLFVI